MSFGLRPYQGPGTGAGYTTGGFATMPIADGDTVSIWTGDPVEITNAGVVTRQNGATGESPTTTNITYGVFMGCQYTDPTGSPVFSPVYIGNDENTDIKAFVANDPNQVFIVEGDGAATQTIVGLNVPLIGFATAGWSTTTPVSQIQVDVSSAATSAALALRILGIVKDGESENNAGTEGPYLIVKWNTAVHSLAQGTGL